MLVKGVPGVKRGHNGWNVLHAMQVKYFLNLMCCVILQQQNNPTCLCAERCEVVDCYFLSWTYRKTSYISRTLVSNKIVDNSDVVGASPAGPAPTTSSFST